MTFWYKRKTRYLIETAGFLLVAGACNHQYLRSHGSRSGESADLANLVSQVQLIDVVSNRIDVLFRTVA